VLEKTCACCWSAAHRLAANPTIVAEPVPSEKGVVRAMRDIEAFHRADWNNLNLQEIEHVYRVRALVSQLVAHCNGAVDDCTCNVNDVNASCDFNNRRKSFAFASLEQGFRICATEAFDIRHVI
jgi:hypothetical protein